MKLLPIALLLSLPLLSQPLPREQWGAPLVNVSEERSTWNIAGRKQTVTLRATDLALTVRAGASTWTMVPSGPQDMLVRSRGKDFPLSLAAAPKKEIVRYDTGFKTGVKITLSGWPGAGELTLFLTVCLEGKDEELVFDVAAKEVETQVRRLDWPTALDAREIDYTLLSNYRGTLLPRNWPKPYHPIRATNPDGSIQAKLAALQESF